MEYRIVIWLDEDGWCDSNEGPWKKLADCEQYAKSEVGLPWVIIDSCNRPLAFGDAREFHTKSDEIIATPDEIEQARDEWCNGLGDDLEIDDNAEASRTANGTWIQAWVWMPKEDNSEEDGDA